MKTVFAATAILLAVGIAAGLAVAAQPRSASVPSVSSAPIAAAPGAAQAQPAAGSAAPAVAAAPAQSAVDIVRRPEDVPPPITRTAPATVRVDLEAKEVVGNMADGATYTYWTFNGKVPGPFVRVRVGDTVELHLKNAAGSKWPHSVDLHAVIGPGGGSAVTQTAPGKETVLTFKALRPGLYVYHCASAPVPMHVAMGMYGLVLVEPEGGLPLVDREFYVVQGELYTTGTTGAKGSFTFDAAKAAQEHPDYVVFNGKPFGLTEAGAMKAKVGEKVRIYFGVGGFLISSFHVIGEIFDRVYPEAALGHPVANVQTTLVPAGGATVVEFTPQVPGRYLLVDHALPRALDKGAVAHLDVSGPEAPDIYKGGTGQ